MEFSTGRRNDSGLLGNQMNRTQHRKFAGLSHFKVHLRRRCPTRTHLNLVLAPIAPEGGQSVGLDLDNPSNASVCRSASEAVKTFLAGPSAHIPNYSAFGE